MEHVNLSYWDIKHLSKPVDVLVVGAGITGLSCALRINQLRPDLSIRVVDRHHITRVASTRNAGFACFGSITEILDDIDTFGEAAAIDLVRRRNEGIQLIRKTFPSGAIEYHHTGGYELLQANDWNQKQILEAAAYLSDKLKSIIGADVFKFLELPDKSFPFVFGTHLVYNPYEGQLNPAAFVQQLANLLPRNSVEIIAGADVSGIEYKNDRHIIQTSIGNMKAGQVVLATNGMTNNFGLEHKRIQPARNMVLVSGEHAINFKGVFHGEQGYIYFRNIGHRLLIGGGRHWDKESEFIDKMGANDNILEQLKNYANEVISPNNPIEFEYQWSGIMGMTENKTPIIEKLSDQLFLAAGYGGMGVALGMHSGFQIAELVCKENFY